jgi:hypothetical protein
MREDHTMGLYTTQDRRGQRLFFSRIWDRLGAHFYLIAACLIVVSVPANLTAIMQPTEILNAFHIQVTESSAWLPYIQLRAVFALGVIGLFAYCLIANSHVHLMTRLVIAYLMLYLLVDVVTVAKFGEFSVQVWLLFSARLLVAILVTLSVEHYFHTQSKLIAEVYGRSN